jgi:uncharacterized protein YqjF (DUF2071 family)
MFQTWQSLTFLHWRYDPDAIRRLLPSQLTLDTFDGVAWIGLTPFLLTNLRPPFVPAFPWISRFPETNVRTYVRGPDGERGIWFFTLEADRLAAVLGARLTYHLPYRWARMSVRRKGGAVEYRSTRKGASGEAWSDIEVLPGGAITVGDLDNFLTARYRLYTVQAGRIAFAQIEHKPWPLQTGRIIRMRQTLFEDVGVPRPAGEPMVHFSETLDVRIERIRWVK